MKRKIKQYFEETAVLMRSVSPIAFAAFVIAVFSMNLLANKSINLPFDFLALDCGIIASWAVFLCMDVFTKHYGPKAATTLTIIAAAFNLVVSLILFVASKIGGVWGAFYDFGELPAINSALDSTFGGTWFVLLGSTIAFIASAIINNFSNWGIGKIFSRRPDGFGAYACRTYLSTAIGQFADNLIFAFLVSHVFFGWTTVQCFTCAATGMLCELLCEVVFSPAGYAVCRRWKKLNVGSEYFNVIEAHKAALEGETK